MKDSPPNLTERRKQLGRQALALGTPSPVGRCSRLDRTEGSEEVGQRNVPPRVARLLAEETAVVVGG